ncbi:phytanoyl-CoA dioxygenase family [Hyaloraphidium curvatum]|nr:phytanoyl-CoA dioxygenase family [Hyaloraphidium curvatum]
MQHWDAGEKPLGEIDPVTKHDLDILLRDGHVTIEGVLSPAEVAHLKETVHRINPQPKMGRNNFEGRKTIRTDGMLGKSSAFDYLCIHPRVVNVIERVLMPTFLLQQIQAIEIFPGETVQPVHTDDGYNRVPRPHPPLNVACMWALDDWTETNGSTVIFEGSHLWPDDRLPDREKDKWISATKKAGSVTIWLGTTWHGGGANITDQTREGPDGKGTSRLGITCQYCQPWLRQNDNFFLEIHPKDVLKMPQRLQSMLGYSIHSPNIGQYNGVHPMKALAPEGIRFLRRIEDQEGSRL